MEELILAAILETTRGPAAADVDRLHRISHDVAHVVRTHSGPLPFEGPRAAEATALFLVAIAAHESGFLAEVDDCRRRGDEERSVTLWQLMRGPNLRGHPLSRVCADRRLAAALALDLLIHIRLRYPRATPQRLADVYASGSPRTSEAARAICSIWQRRCERARLTGAFCHARRPIAGEDES